MALEIPLGAGVATGQGLCDFILHRVPHAWHQTGAERMWVVKSSLTFLFILTTMIY